MKHISILVLLVLILPSCSNNTSQISSGHDLKFSSLPTKWDEAVPLGNGMLGALVWQKEGKLRISLDRVDLWDLRPMSNLDFSQFTYEWVYEQWKNNTYENVQDQMDVPYDKRVAPTKIPAAALEFDISDFGEVKEVLLSVDKALCTVSWQNGRVLKVFINGNEDTGWYQFENCESIPEPELLPPAYEKPEENFQENLKFKEDLALLGYSLGEVKRNKQELEYNQEGWGGFEYSVLVKWDNTDNTSTGCWSISSSFPGWADQPSASENVNSSFKNGFNQSLEAHLNWWSEFWSRSSVSLPDSLIERQYYLEMYKFGSVARKHTPPISLQAVWTADNGKLPPWKGDFHHDLNTQLSYWPAYAGNYTDLAEGFVNWLWKYKSTFEKYTKDYYGHDGLNVPGVTTLTGEPMGVDTILTWTNSFFMAGTSLLPSVEIHHGSRFS